MEIYQGIVALHIMIKGILHIPVNKKKVTDNSNKEEKRIKHLSTRAIINQTQAVSKLPCIIYYISYTLYYRQYCCVTRLTQTIRRDWSDIPVAVWKQRIQWPVSPFCQHQRWTPRDISLSVCIGPVTLDWAWDSDFTKDCLNNNNTWHVTLRCNYNLFNKLVSIVDKSTSKRCTWTLDFNNYFGF